MEGAENSPACVGSGTVSNCPPGRVVAVRSFARPKSSSLTIGGATMGPLTNIARFQSPDILALGPKTDILCDKRPRQALFSATFRAFPP